MSNKILIEEPDWQKYCFWDKETHRWELNEEGSKKPNIVEEYKKWFKGYFGLY